MIIGYLHIQAVVWMIKPGGPASAGRIVKDVRNRDCQRLHAFHMVVSHFVVLEIEDTSSLSDNRVELLLPIVVVVVLVVLVVLVLVLA